MNSISQSKGPSETSLIYYRTVKVAEYVRELTGFPGTKYDDQVDSTTQALDYSTNVGVGVHIREPRILR